MEQEYVDPKVAFLLKLVNMVDSANWNMISGKPFTANKILATILSVISIEGEGTDELKKLQEQAITNYDAFLNVRAEVVRKTHFLISQYLNGTYFKDFKVAKPIKGKTAHIGVNQDG